jgi:ATP-dependent RNA helicase DDX54/DBP10
MVSPDELTVVFAATKHHVELLHELLTRAGVDNTYLYSSLDATARKINAAKFCRRITRTLIVTDVAARGIDIPLLDNVVNYHFPAKGKLFVHRVGRVARAGRSGKAYSLVCADEVPFLLDLHLFLGRPLENFGSVTQPILEPEKDIVRRIMNESTELQSIEGAAWNGMRKYIASRPKPSSESVRRSKLLRRSVESGEGWCQLDC